MKIKHISELSVTATSHGCGDKRVLLSKGETDTALTQIAVTRLKVGDSVAAHSHATMEECFIVRNEEIFITVDGVEVRCRKDDCLHIRAGESHSVLAVTDCELLTIGCAVK
jgi:mannose-6-phosphate isomerase-like protein (cupin superfamily)